VLCKESTGRNVCLDGKFSNNVLGEEELFLVIIVFAVKEGSILVMSFS
jgi:hypothetical protein